MCAASEYVGETGAQEIDTATLAKLAEYRTSFLDLDEHAGVQIEVATPAARAVDLDPEQTIEPSRNAWSRADDWQDERNTLDTTPALEAVTDAPFGSPAQIDLF